MKKYRLIVVLALIALAVVIFPPFHVHRIASGAREGVGNDHGASSDIPAQAARFWESRLASQQVPSTDWRVLIKALQENAEQANRRYGHRPGIGGPSFYLVSGEARVASIDPSGVWLEASDLGDWRVLLQTGPIFGSALRDATGLLRLEDFSSFDFNELAAQLNRLAESRIAPGLRRDARVGSELRFVAAGRIDRVSGDGRTVLLEPIRVSLK